MPNSISKRAFVRDPEEERMVGVVVVSHSAEIARGVVELAGQMAGV
jgi:hypothetical protein